MEHCDMSRSRPVQMSYFFDVVYCLYTTVFNMNLDAISMGPLFFLSNFFFSKLRDRTITRNIYTTLLFLLLLI